MVVGDVYPDGDITTEWQVNPPVNHFFTIDEDKGVPSMSDQIFCWHQDDNKTDTFHMDDSIQGIEEYTQVKVYIYVINMHSPSPQPRKINIYVNGGWLIAKDISPGLESWQSFIWGSLSGNQASLDALRVTVQTFNMVDDKITDDAIQIGAMYAEITYSVAEVGYQHDFMGVPAANIDSVNGIPSANIDTIKGV